MDIDTNNVNTNNVNTNNVNTNNKYNIIRNNKFYLGGFVTLTFLGLFYWKYQD